MQNYKLPIKLNQKSGNFLSSSAIPHLSSLISKLSPLISHLRSQISYLLSLISHQKILITHHSLLIAFIFLITSCNKKENTSTSTDILNESWDTIVAHAKGTDVSLIMWQGDPFINKYMQNYVVPELKKQFDIDLNISAGQGNDLVKIVMTDKEAGKKTGTIDLNWINGETFFQMRQINGLFGPFTHKLPNIQYVDLQNPFIGIDFQQNIDGYESPWGNVQLALIYDSVRVTTTPKTLDELENWVKQNPGKFTIPYEFTGLTLLKSWLIGIAGSEKELEGKFDEEKYKKYSALLWQKLNAMKKYFWKEGETFPNSLAQLHQMFANGEVYFTMSNNDGEVDNKVLQGLFPETARSYVYNSGTIQNSHYMGIIFNAPNKAGAMVVCNFLMSPEAQYEKMKPEVWGDGTILNMQKLSPEWQQKFTNIPTRKYAPLRKDIQPYALMELAPEYMIRMFDDFRTEVIEK